MAVVCLRGALVLAALLGPTAAGATPWPPPPRQEWDCEIVLQGLAWAAQGTVGVVPDDMSFPVDASFGDLYWPFDPGAAMRLEARSPMSVLMAGVTYFHLDAKRDVEISGVTTRGDLNTTQWIFEGGAGYRFSQNIEVLGTARYYLVGNGSSFGSVAIHDEDDSWMDVFLGVRLIDTQGPVVASVRGEIGAGASQFAWFGSVELAYRVGEATSIRAEYRILSSDRDPWEAGDIAWDVVQNGLGVGLGFAF